MWALSIAIFAICKVISWVGRARHPDEASKRALFYLTCWPGLNAAEFLDPNLAPRPRFSEILGAIFTTIAGAAMIWFVSEQIPADWRLVRAWTGMIGLIWLLHFGILHLVSCFWRFFGINASPLMNTPLMSRGMTEFWSLRWNTAFRDLSNRFLFRPNARRFGIPSATWIVFLVSGLVHDAVISIPAGGGFGRPTLYFLIQAGGLFLERKLQISGTQRGRLFTYIIVGAPVMLLFHEPFAFNVILPFLDFCNGR